MDAPTSISLLSLLIAVGTALVARRVFRGEPAYRNGKLLEILEIMRTVRQQLASDATGEKAAIITAKMAEIDRQLEENRLRIGELDELVHEIRRTIKPGRLPQHG